MKTTRLLPLKRLLAKAAYQVADRAGFAVAGVNVLCYHSISNHASPYTVTLKRCISHLEAISTYDTFLDASIIASWITFGQLPASGVLLTFDDGYQDILSLLPYTQKYGIKPLLFVLSQPEKINRGELDHSGQLLNWQEIKLLIKQGWTIGCHSATHTDLTTLSDRELVAEISGSKKTLEKKLNIPIHYFAYPKGLITDRIKRAVTSAGYKAAFSTQPGQIKPTTSIWNLPRIVVNSSHIAAEFPIIYSPSTYALRSVVDRVTRAKILSL